MPSLRPVYLFLGLSNCSFRRGYFDGFLAEDEQKPKLLSASPDSRHLLQNSKVPKNVIGFNTHGQRVTGHIHLDVDVSLAFLL